MIGCKGRLQNKTRSDEFLLAIFKFCTINHLRKFNSTFSILDFLCSFFIQEMTKASSLKSRPLFPSALITALKECWSKSSSEDTPTNCLIITRSLLSSTLVLTSATCPMPALDSSQSLTTVIGKDFHSIRNYFAVVFKFLCEKSILKALNSKLLVRNVNSIGQYFFILAHFFAFSN